MTDYVLVKAGSFMMGSPPDKPGRYSNEQQHAVNIRHDYYLKATPVTEKEWRELMGNNPSTQFTNRPHNELADDCPVQNVSWFDAVAYCNKLSEQDGLTPYYTLTNARGTPGRGDFECEVGLRPEAEGHRLPTEAEWEFAARGGNAGGTAEPLENVAWYYANAGDRTHPVRSKYPNRLGLFDMLGNTWEWVQDRYHASYAGAPTDGSAWEAGGGSGRVRRGGGCRSGADVLRAANRSGSTPGSSVNDLGFRCARNVVIDTDTHKCTAIDGCPKIDFTKLPVGTKLKTRDGRDARILATDLCGPCPVVVAIQFTERNNTESYTR